MTVKQKKLVENYIRKEVRRRLDEDSKVSKYGNAKTDKLIVALLKSFKKHLGQNLNQEGLIPCAEECIYLVHLHK